MAWGNYADDAARYLPRGWKTFKKALEDIASGDFDLKAIARQEAGLFEQVKDALARGQSSWHRDATRGENYLKELYRPLEREMREAIAPVVQERAAQQKALGAMVNSAISEQAPDLVRSVLQDQVESAMRKAALAQRMQVNDAMSKARLRFEDLTEQELRDIIRFLGGQA